MAFWEVGHRWGLETRLWGTTGQVMFFCSHLLLTVPPGRLRSGALPVHWGRGTPGFCRVEAGRVESLEENPGAGPPSSSQASVLVTTWPRWSHLLVLVGQPQVPSLLTNSLLFRKKGERNHYNRQEEGADGRCFISKN